MILVDTSVWIDHFRLTEAMLESLLEKERVLLHPMILGELTVGNLSPRKKALSDLRKLPFILTATDEEVLSLIERHSLFGQGLGYVDCHLLAAVRATPDAVLWTRDKRLRSAAQRLEFPVQPEVYVQ